MAGLPSDQWMLELQNWFAVNMARLQHSVVEYATGPTDLGSLGEVIPLAGVQTLEQSLCNSQLVPLPVGYQNFGFLGIMIIVVLGGIMFVLGCIGPKLGCYIKERREHISDYALAWHFDEKLQLHRLAQKGAGWGTKWNIQMGAIPITASEERLGRYIIAKNEQGEFGAHIESPDY